MRREYVGGAQSARLTANLGGTTSDLTISCNDLSNWPTGVGSKPFYVVIDRGTVSEEKILCSSRSGNTLTVYNVGGNNGRGADDTSITAHSSNAVIEHVFTATDADEANAHVNDTTTDVHPQYILESVANAKGDLLVATANDTWSRVGVGTNGQYLVADSAETSGVKWAALPAPPTPVIYAAWSGIAKWDGTNVPGGVPLTPIHVRNASGLAASMTVTFPVGRFSQAPVVVVTPGLPDNMSWGIYAQAYVEYCSSSSVSLGIYNVGPQNTSFNQATFYVHAHQMTSTSGAG